MIGRRGILRAGLAGLAAAALWRVGAGGAGVWPGGSDEGLALVAAARAQAGVTLIYDPAYVALDFPGGDVPAERGVCTDVLIRALRRAQGLDLQAVVHADMKADFAAYPALWGLKRPDRNIDHRRVPNLQCLFRRVGADRAPFADAQAFRPGDVVTSVLPGNLPHLMIVSDRAAPGAERPLVLHNIGRGTREEDGLFAYPLTGLYRLEPAALDRMRALQG